MKANIQGGKKIGSLKYELCYLPETDQINKHDMKGKFAIKRRIGNYKDGWGP